MPLSIAIDGPVGAGKSTISDAVARKLNMIHLDTGAMYRAVGLCAMDNGIDIRDEEKVTQMCREGKALVDVLYADGTQITLLNGEDVNGRIRTQEAGEAASAVSRYRYVREMLVRRQQEIARKQDILIDGRDICTVVLPDATVKIYLTATAEERARRRQLQLAEKGQQIPFEEILAEVNARDWQDMHREVDPLRIAPGAVVVDTSDLDFDGSVQAVLRCVEEAGRS
ncbi:MAG: (d)CMP kinase [Clostridiales bacterium]|nr:(d)CMP kinase [Clostridiales bacterium]